MEWLKHSWRRLLEWEAPYHLPGGDVTGQPGHRDLMRMTQRELADLPFDFAMKAPQDCGPSRRTGRHQPRSD